MKAIFSLLLLSATLAHGQKQANVWAFGNHSGLDFNKNPPAVITTSLPLQVDGCLWCPPDSINGYDEGASSICDSSGRLLFYSNGQQVWNKNHKLLPNGDSLMGNFSAEQSALFLPKPGSSSLFYLFTMDSFQDTSRFGLRYSVIDACADSGRGDVVVGMKNIPLLDTTGEKLTTVKHQNGHDYWIIGHKFWTNKFYVFRLSSLGVSDTVISSIGRVHKDSLSPTSVSPEFGAMTSSPDGRHIIVVNGNVMADQYLSELFDFDPATGKVSNYIDLQTRQTTIGKRNTPYGCSFSPNSSKVYIGAFFDTARTAIGTQYPVLAQYDLSMGTMFPDSIRHSLKWIRAENEDSVETNMGLQMSPLSLQIGPDGKIYCSGFTKYLWILERPNLAGPACGAHINTAFTVGKTYTMPNILPSYKYDNAVPCPKETFVPVLPQKEATDIYPNPITETFTIACEGNWKATLSDVIQGRTVASYSGNGRTSFSKGTLLPGIYMLCIQDTDAFVVRKKIVIQ